MTPNRNGLLECRDCGESVHVRHATDARCSDCHERYLDECAQWNESDLETYGTVPALVTGQPAFTPSYAIADHAERYSTDGRYGGYVGVEVKAGSGVFVLRAEEQEEVAT